MATVSVLELCGNLMKLIGLFLCVWLDGVFANRILPPVCIFTTGSPAVPNIALMGRATQSSLHDINGVAAHAVDGNKNPNYEGLSCGHTQADFGPWWRLDLQEQHTIITVVITNREDCCSERLRGVQVWVGDSLEKGGHDNFHIQLILQDLVRFCCYGTVGRYVTVLIPNRTEFLTLCEVEVFGSVPCKILPGVLKWLPCSIPEMAAV
nr:PREDICTED: fucolectin-like [Latimeria chalumnae]|eukprot:XP_014349315.1 PREDICTED: fucolectin-like [Latimeria chalumnae]